MLSIARSRYTLAAQFLFLLTNAIGVLVGIFYNANTPDLYPNNAHHKLGWLVTWVVGAQVLVGLVGRVAGTMNRSSRTGHRKEEEQSFIPVSTEAMAEHHRMNQGLFSSPYRGSNDSGQGTERNTESLRSASLSTMVGHESPIELNDRACTTKRMKRIWSSSLLRCSLRAPRGRLSPRSEAKSQLRRGKLSCLVTDSWIVQFLSLDISRFARGSLLTRVSS